jgi:dTDP-4-dehydrorhamnose reductase
MRIVVTGANGQLGQAICACFATSHTLIPLQRPAFDLDNPRAIPSLIPPDTDLVIHTAAYTHVDGCARDPLRAYRTNGLATHAVALACQRHAIPLVYISTNEVFSGSHSHPYVEYDQPAPINPYGHSKWVGEQVVRDLLTQFYIVRVAWLFGGRQNFVQTMLRLAANPPADGIRMVDDEIGSPTFAPDVAAALLRLIDTHCYGIYHLINAGTCSRYAFAQTIAHQAGYRDLPITPIHLHEYQRASTPPPYTPLANYAAATLGITLRPWQDALSAHLQQFADHQPARLQP